MVTMTLIEFLRARIDEYEAAARKAMPYGHGAWTYVDGDRGPQVDLNPGEGEALETWTREGSSSVWTCDDPDDGCQDVAASWAAEGEHIARWDPARVLAEIAAKRRIIDEYEQREREATSGIEQAKVFGYHATGLLIAIRLLALPDAEHPDYREEWRP